METSSNYVKRRYLTERAPGSFSGLSGFLLNNPHYKDKSKVESSLRELDSYSLHKPTRKGRRRTVWCSYIDYLWVSDLAFYPKYSRQNQSSKYLLVTVDCFSKFLFVEPLPNKTSQEVVEGFKRIFSKSKRKPEKLWTDFGTEYFGKKTVNFLKSENIEIYKVFTPLKASIAERYVRRIKTVIERHFTLTNSHRYIDVLPELVKGINSSYNRSIKMSPSSVTKKNESQVWANLYDNVINSKRQKPKYSVGDKVRISEKKIRFFSKGYSRNWGQEVMVIKAVRNLIPTPVYELQDEQENPIEGTFYEFELQLVEDGTV
jgi:hypothetical protein